VSRYMSAARAYLRAKSCKAKADLWRGSTHNQRTPSGSLNAWFKKDSQLRSRPPALAARTLTLQGRQPLALHIRTTSLSLFAATTASSSAGECTCTSTQHKLKEARPVRGATLIPRFLPVITDTTSGSSDKALNRTPFSSTHGCDAQHLFALPAEPRQYLTNGLCGKRGRLRQWE